MSYWVEKGIGELKEWEKRVLEFLSERLSPEALTYYLEEYQRDIRGSFERAKKGEGLFTLSIFDAINSLSQLRSLLDELSPLPSGTMSVEVAARFALLSFRAGMETGRIQPARAVEVYRWKIDRAEKEFEEKLQHAGKEAIVESARKSANCRHAPRKEVEGKAERVARALWESGNTLLHHKMARYLAEEYQENGRHPFTTIPGVKDENTIKKLREITKRVAEEMGKPELIYNQFSKK